jgi:hypothetical protein
MVDGVDLWARVSRLRWWQTFRYVRWLHLDYRLNGPGQLTACPVCWAAVWRVQQDDHLAWHEDNR